MQHPNESKKDQSTNKSLHPMSFIFFMEKNNEYALYKWPFYYENKEVECEINLHYIIEYVHYQFCDIFNVKIHS